MSPDIMTPVLHIVLIEDNPDDALLITRAVEHAGYVVQAQRVQTAEELRDTLAQGTWDLVLADYSLPHFSATEGLAILKEIGLDVPFIIVSGCIGEEVAVQLIKDGAAGYVMKDHLSLLGPAVQRELRDAGERHRKRDVERSLAESEERYRVLVESQTDLLVKTGPAGSREVASFEISQPYSLSDPLTPARTTFDSATSQPGQPLPASLKGPLDLWLRVLPVPTATLDTRVDFDPVTHNLQSTSLSGGYSKGANALNLTWYSSYDPTGQVTSSQTRLFFGLAPGNSHWRLESQISYDVHQHQLLEQRYVFRWRGSCWNAMFELHDYRIQPYKTRDYRISIDLTGLGTFLDIKGALNSFAQ